MMYLKITDLAVIAGIGDFCMLRLPAAPTLLFLLLTLTSENAVSSPERAKSLQPLYSQIKQPCFFYVYLLVFTLKMQKELFFY